MVPPLVDGVHSIDFDELDDHIHMLSWDDSKPEPMESDEIYEIGGVTLGLQMPTPFKLVPEATSVQTATIEPLTFPHYSAQMPFVLIPNVEEVQTPYVDDIHILDIRYVIHGGRVVRQQSPIATRPLEGTFTLKEVRKENNDILR